MGRQRPPAPEPLPAKKTLMLSPVSMVIAIRRGNVNWSRAILVSEEGRVYLIIDPKDVVQLSGDTNRILPVSRGTVFQVHFYSGKTPSNVIGEPAGQIRTIAAAQVDGPNIRVEVEQWSGEEVEVGVDVAA